MVCEFPKVFSDDLPRVPLDRENDFGINLILDTHLISIPPCIMALAELKELKKELKGLLDKGLSVLVCLRGVLLFSSCEKEWISFDVY